MIDSSLRRDFEFRPLTGEVEMGLAEAVAHGRDLPTQVTLALHAALTHVGGLEPDVDLIDALSVADRQYLMMRLAAQLGFDQVWLTATCGHCDQSFDFSLSYSQLPVKTASISFPSARISTEQGVLTMRVPTGSDQRAILSVRDGQQARRLLAQRCVIDWDGGDVAALKLTADQVASIEAALEAVAPEVTTEVLATCPECGANNQVAIDPYFCLSRVNQDLFSEVHRLALHYHWSETEILKMPQWRRRRYLTLIDRSRGMMR